MDKLLEYAIQQGGGYLLAALMFLLYRRDVMQKLQEEKDDKRILIDLVSDTKSALEELSSAIRNLR